MARSSGSKTLEAVGRERRHHIKRTSFGTRGCHENLSKLGGVSSVLVIFFLKTVRLR